MPENKLNHLKHFHPILFLVVVYAHIAFVKYMYYVNRMAWQWTETLVEIRVTLADIRGTTK